MKKELRVMPIGKYKGRTFDSIAASDPRYLDWVIITMMGDVREAASAALSRWKPRVGSA